MGPSFPHVFIPQILNYSNMTDRTSDVEARVFIAKKSMWQSIFANPKVLFIAFFASYVRIAFVRLTALTFSDLVVLNMVTNKVFWASPWS
jgi:hypothetical protein